jgi:hypothetical protein
MALYVVQQRNTNPESAFQRWQRGSDLYHPTYASAMFELVMERMADAELCMSEWEYRIVEAGQDE